MSAGYTRYGYAIKKIDSQKMLSMGSFLCGSGYECGRTGFDAQHYAT